MQLSIEAVRDLARLLRESGLREIALKDVDGATGEPFRVSLKSGAARETHYVTLPASSAPSSAAQTAAPSATSSAAQTAANDALPTGAANTGAANGAATTAPIAAPDAVITATAVGLFRQMSPPLEIGAAVKAGQVVAIVESLKIPNEIVAAQAGRVSQLLAEDGQGVEYGQPLLAIAPQGGDKS